LRRARLCISSDTGPLHLAAAVGTPCVSLHGTTWAERSGPYGQQHVALQKMSLKDPLDRSRKTTSAELMEAISVEMVREASDRVLRRDASHAA
jgi:ADP-heptose:LPS heptosyltransferase